MCYDTAQLAFRIYKEAIRLNASPNEIEELKKKWEKLKEGYIDIYHASGFSHPKLVVFTENDGQIDIKTPYWGLIPHWIKDVASAKEIWNKTLNARGETLFEKPSFSEAVKSKRCIIPLSGFYEHHYLKGKAIPYFIRNKNAERLFVAGIMENWINPENQKETETFSIVTSKGNELMTFIHNNPKLKEARMPLLLNDADARVWLNGDENQIKEIIKPNDSLELEAHTVRSINGKEYIGNCPEIQEKYDYNLSDTPTLFD